ncbi:ABC transporter permease [Candidatus Poribacteria bacterium]|nr:ABC transporter permease [Candidatus Poribacteria bacterium]
MFIILLKLAWKNIFRNKRRTFIASIAIGIGLAALIFLDALMIGMSDILARTATESFLGDAQIHFKEYRDTQDVSMTIQDVDKVTSMLAKEKIVHNFSRRTYSTAMIMSSANTSAINLVGVNPPKEKHISQIDDRIIEGEFFTEESPHDIVIGSKLSETLEVDLGDKVVVTVAQSGSGDFFEDWFRISGIFYFADEGMNGGMAFVRLHKAQEMLALKNNVHEIAIKFTSATYGQNPDLEFWDTYSEYDNEVLSWTDILPELQSMFDMFEYSKYIVGVLLFVVVVFGIINTLFMSLYERMFEFGVLRAVGTRPFGMARLILFEAGSLAIVSIILGGILGFVLTTIFSQVGINYTGIEMMGVTLQESIYPVLTLEQYTFFPISLFIFTIIAGLYPAWHVAKMSPVEAMRRSF